MQKEILKELENLRDETEFVINNEDVLETKNIEEYLKKFEKIR